MMLTAEWRTVCALIGAYLPFPGSGFVERNGSTYRFVTS
jgi:hypothetical protein